jgi:bacillaene synthase trans-acting acyltransferase
MNKQIIFMFSGQGSQYYQMGKELYENHEQFRYWMDHCDEMVSPLIQTSLIDILYRSEGKSKPFDRLLYSNPALLCIEYSLFNVLKGMGIEADFLMGYSLGEIIASVVSGSISLKDGIQLVVDLSKFAEEKSKPAEMLAIMESKTLMNEFPELFKDCWLTASNFKANFVVCGFSNTIQALQQNLNKKGITSQLLPVRYGFHTELIDPFETEYKQRVRKIHPLPHKIPIISSLRTEIVRELDEDYFWEVIRYPINFEKTIEQVLKKGDYIFIDVGPSGSMATFVKYILPSDSASISFQMINPFGKDLNSVEKLQASLFKNVS